MHRRPRRGGSIPACAGEPGSHADFPQSHGSIPACAGEPTSRLAVPLGSIPACAGEPRSRRRPPRLRRVYPRVCGGTAFTVLDIGLPTGLSPRVRGNHGLSGLVEDMSIPACAGEPRIGRGHGGVYPRVCGGTSVAAASTPSSSGLSPRVRGNRGILRPSATPRVGLDLWVYPRVCGGTSVKYLTKVRLSSVFSCQ